MKLILFILLPFTLTAQNTDTVCVDKIKFKATLIKLADYNLLQKDNEFLQKDTTALHKEIGRKENVIIKIQQQRNTYKSLDSLSQIQIAAKGKIISDQDLIINKSKKKFSPFTSGAIGVILGFLIAIFMHK